MQKVAFGIAFFAVAAGAIVAFADGREASYSVHVDAPATHKGQKASARVKITPGVGCHLNKEYPTSLVWSAVPAGVTVAKPKLTAKDAARFEEAGAEFVVDFTPAELGHKVIGGELKFALCTTNTCDPKKSAVSFEIDVK